MSSGERPVVEAFLLVDSPSQRLGYWTKALAALDSPDAPPLAEVVAHYDARTDQAVLSLRYHSSPRDPTPLSFVGDVAMVAEVEFVSLGELSSRERQRFSTERLARCSLAIDHKRYVVDALQELVRRLRYQRASSPSPRSDTADPIPFVRAKGTRDELPPSRPSHEPGLTLDRPGSGAAPSHRPSSHETALTLDRPSSRETSAHPRSTTPPQVPAAPDPAAPQNQQFADSTRIIVDDELRYRVPPPLPRAVRRTTAPPPVDEQRVQHVRNTIAARYLRSGKWLPTRIASLSLKSATLMTSALPRVDDSVDVALSYAGHRAVVRGTVSTVSSTHDAATSGASTFAVTFDLDAASRRQLTALLSAALAANVTIKPPPPRRAPRFVVEWSVCLGTERGIIRADAFDVSSGGMFVRPAVAIDLGSTCTFSVVLDDGGAAVSGRAHVVRHLDEQSAAACGVSPGFGLSIIEMSDLNRQRWEAFIARIERRAGKRVLVGAPPARLAKLQSILSAAGYAVMGSGDPGALVHLANADTRPVDAALIDSRWLVNGGLGSWVENALSARQVPCVHANADARGARTSVDELLHILD